MSAEMDSVTSPVDVYVRLLNEGTEVSRPTRALDLGNGLFRILATPDYSPDDETWEFPPGSIVKCERRRDSSGEYLIAVKGGDSRLAGRR